MGQWKYPTTSICFACHPSNSSSIWKLLARQIYMQLHFYANKPFPFVKKLFLSCKLLTTQGQLRLRGVPFPTSPGLRVYEMSVEGPTPRRRKHRQLPPPNVHAKDNWIFLPIRHSQFQPHPPTHSTQLAHSH